MKPEKTKTNITYFVSLATHKRLKQHALDNNTSLQQILDEALDTYFSVRGLPPIDRTLSLWSQKGKSDRLGRVICPGNARPMTAPARRRKGKSTAETGLEAHDLASRPKDFLTKGEVRALLAAAKDGRHGARDHLLLTGSSSTPCGPSRPAACASTRWTSRPRGCGLTA
jgi:hypothetical protein